MPTIKFRLAFRRPFVSQLELRDYSRQCGQGLRICPSVAYTLYYAFVRSSYERKKRIKAYQSD